MFIFRIRPVGTKTIRFKVLVMMPTSYKLMSFFITRPVTVFAALTFVVEHIVHLSISVLLFCLNHIFSFIFRRITTITSKSL